MLVLKSRILILFLLLMPLFAVSQNNSASLEKKVQGFSHPESVVYDKQNDMLYISNIGEKEPEDGFISKVTPEGDIIELKWIPGLDDPKGLQIADNKLYVTDVTDLVVMDLNHAEILKRIPVEGAEFLNDITIDANGNLFISDMVKSSIYILRSGAEEVTEWLSTNDLESPNGLLAVNGSLYVAAWGEDNGGNFLKINMGNQEIEQVSSEAIGNLDGIQPAENNNFYISDWATGRIYKISKTGDEQEILTSEKSAGDILYIQDTQTLVLPMNVQNAVWWYQIN